MKKSKEIYHEFWYFWIQNGQGWHPQDSSINNILNRLGDDAIEDETLKQQLQPFLQRHSFELREHGIRRVTIVLFRKGQYPGYFTLREATDYTKDQTIRTSYGLST